MKEIPAALCYPASVSSPFFTNATFRSLILRYTHARALHLHKQNHNRSQMGQVPYNTKSVFSSSLIFQRIERRGTERRTQNTKKIHRGGSVPSSGRLRWVAGVVGFLSQSLGHRRACYGFWRNAIGVVCCGGQLSSASSPQLPPVPDLRLCSGTCYTTLGPTHLTSTLVVLKPLLVRLDPSNGWPDIRSALRVASLCDEIYLR